MYNIAHVFTMHLIRGCDLYPSIYGNEIGNKKICEGGNKSGLHGPRNMLIQKETETNDSNVKLMRIIEMVKERNECLCFLLI